MNNLFEITDGSDSDSDYEVLQVVVLRRKKVIKIRPNFFQCIDDEDFRARFRMTKESANIVLSLIEDKLNRGTRNNAILPHQKLLLTLRFYATGNFQQTVGDLAGVSVSTASRVITEVTHHIAKLRPQFIGIPNDLEKLSKIKSDFYRIAKFPRVIAAMDCTHVKIISPGGDEAEVFRNRKGFFSINVQTLCDSKLQILDIVARWPGSVHDSRVYNNSRIASRILAKEFGDSIIVADSGYENNCTILTPLLTCRNAAESLYNEAHIRTRNCVERSYGVWKRRFPILSTGIRMHVSKVPGIIVATAVLHNICCMHNDTVPHLPFDVTDAIENVPTTTINNDNNNHVRRTLIETHFATL